jgi:tripartite-type tricarboxylate transporter receptor subunit TctC
MSGRRISRRSALVTGLGAALVPAMPTLGRAQDATKFPDRPIRLIVSTAAGGGVDAFARLVAAKMQTVLGQPIAVEDKAGAGGSFAADLVYHSSPDGYVLLASQPAPITTNALLIRGLNYDPAKLAPVAIMSHLPNVLLVRPDLPQKTVQELIAYAKANPGKLNYASQGVGTTSHLTAELFSSITHVKLTHVPYKGTGPALNDIISSHVDMFFTELSTSAQLNKAGKARILAVTTKQRVPAIPDIPTLAESGVDGCESDTWNAITAPPKTPAAIVAKLNDAANKAMHSPELLERYKALDATPGGGTPAEMAAFIKQETERWSAVIKAANIQPE